MGVVASGRAAITAAASAERRVVVVKERAGVVVAADCDYDHGGRFRTGPTGRDRGVSDRPGAS